MDSSTTKTVRDRMKNMFIWSPRFTSSMIWPPVPVVHS
jgi:hypothetical protein